ncbi:hypothetical protein V473_15130 [Sphingobium cupriresistens LL01]|uniref:Uncharacterized protein n=1 Tax=Sphingobium cupriresistens LL01 TaxID=1420583 RepID=A0A0J7XSP1_9SPHN|nr:hypothetical protein V473_15130 [Sphingobium cupriresistens LL01]
MNLKERIDAGRDSDVAQSFRAATEMINKVESGEMPVSQMDQATQID